jgi:transcriptional antiterminator NusG
MSAWFVVQANPKCEDKAERNLRRAGFTVYSPHAKIERYSKRKKIFREVTLRLMPRYIFVEIEHEHQVPWYALRACEGVEKVLGTDGRPCRLRRADTKLLEDVIAAEAALQFDETRAGKLHRREIGRSKKENSRMRFPVGSRVRAVKGPFSAFEGVVTNVNGRGAIDALLNVFGRMTPVEFPLESVEPVDEAA